MENPLSKLTSKITASAESHDKSTKSDEDLENDVLVQFSIPLNIDVPETVLTPSGIKSVRFSETKPKGFSMRQVEEFHKQTTDSVAFYTTALDLRNKHVHKLAEEVDKYKTDWLNAKYQLEMYSGLERQVVTDADGNPLTEDQLSEQQQEVLMLEEKISALQDEMLIVNKERKNFQDEIADLKDQLHNAPPALPIPANTPIAVSNEALGDAERQELEAFRQNQIALDEWEQAVTAEYTRLEEENSSLKEQLVTMEQGSFASLESSTLSLVKVEELERIIQGHEQTQAEMQASLTAIQQELVTAQSQSVSLSAELENAQQAVSGNSQLETYIAQLEEHAQTVQSQMESLQGDLEQAQTNLAQAQSELTQTQGSLEQAHSESQTLQAQLAESQHSQGSGVGVDTDLIAQYESSIQQFEGYVEELNTHITSLEGMITNLEGDLKLKDAEIEKIQSATRSNGGSQYVEGYGNLPATINPDEDL